MSVRWFQRGLDAGAVQSAQTHHGPNALLEPPPKPLWRTSARRFNGPLICILFGAAMLAVALTNALIGSFQEGRAVATVLAENDRMRGLARHLGFVESHAHAGEGVHGIVLDLAPATATPPP